MTDGPQIPHPPTQPPPPPPPPVDPNIPGLPKGGGDDDGDQTTDPGSGSNP